MLVRTPLGSALTGAMWNGWGADSASTRFQPVAVGGLTAADVPNLTLKWAVGFPNGQYVASQPTVVGGRIYVGLGAPGGVMAIDAATGVPAGRSAPRISCARLSPSAK